MKQLIFILFFMTASVIGFSADFQKVSSGGFNFQWKVDGSNLTVIMSAQISGWVAVGIDPKFAMSEANFIIGYVKNGKVVVSDDYGAQPMLHVPVTSLGGKSLVAAVTGKEEGGITEIQFTLPLNPGDQYHKNLVPGKEYKILIACGGGKDFTSMHSDVAKFKIKL